jgi:GT2 family glycosyltransferase
VHVLIDVSSVLDGDAITPLVDALDEDGVVAAGWRGALVDTDDAWRQVTDAGPGEVDVLLGYLVALDRDAARAADVPHPKARFYRNADLELSLALRAAGGRLVVPPGELPVHQERHRGYHDSDPALRDRESRKNYDRLLSTYRGRDEILAPRPH